MMVTTLRDFLASRDPNVKLEEKSIEYFTTKYHEQMHSMLKDEFLSRGMYHTRNTIKNIANPTRWRSYACRSIPAMDET